MTINLYTFGRVVKHRIQCNVKCNFIIKHKFHFLSSFNFNSFNSCLIQINSHVAIAIVRNSAFALDLVITCCFLIEDTKHSSIYNTISRSDSSVKGDPPSLNDYWDHMEKLFLVCFSNWCDSSNNLDNFDKLGTIFWRLDKMGCPNLIRSKFGESTTGQIIMELVELRKIVH